MRGALSGLPLRAALKRGALVTAANWPVVLIQFTMISVLRLGVGVPVIGGVFVVAVVSGADVRGLLGQDVSAAGGLVAAALAGHPETLLLFLAAVGLVGVGGTMMVSLAQAAIALILVRGEGAGGELHRSPVRLGAIRQAQAFSLDAVLDGARRFGRRFVLLGVWLCAAYVVLGGAAVVVLRLLLMVGDERSAPVIWGLGGLGVAVGLLIAVAGVHLVYALLQVIMATDDCRLSQAVSRLRAFVLHDARQVAGVYGVVLGLVLLATAASVLATAGLALVAWVPIVGLAVVPLQLAAWLVRGMVFHYMELGAWSAYQSHYRRYAEPLSTPEPSPAWEGRL